MTKEQINAIKARCEAATPGPWKAVRGRWDCGDDCSNEKMNTCDLVSSSCGKGICIEPAMVDTVLTVPCGEYDCMNNMDAEFIAHAREDIPALLEALEEAENSSHAGWDGFETVNRICERLENENRHYQAQAERICECETGRQMRDAYPLLYACPTVKYCQYCGGKLVTTNDKL